MRVIEADGSSTEQRYWEPRYERRPEHANWSARDWEDAIEDALRTAVRRRLVADIPVGVLLSGGLDSSLIVGLLAQEGQTGLATFSIGFESVGGQEGDEFAYSDVIAEHFGTDHHRIRVGSDELAGSLGHAIGAMAEPMVSHDVVAFDLLSERVSQSIKVVQSGQGADEVFAGYHWYPPLAGLDREAGIAAYAERFFDRDHAAMARVVSDRYALAEDPSLAFVRAHMSRAGADTSVDAALRLDSEIMLVDDPVKRVDNMSMAWGLEARVPFLDHDLVELAAMCPPELKLADGGKGVLKAIGRRIIPPEVIDRPKGYFPVPAITHLEGKVLDLVRDALASDAARERGAVPAGVRARAPRRPERRAHPAQGQQALAAGTARALAADARGLSMTTPRASPGAAGGRRCRPRRRSPAGRGSEPSAHQLQGMQSDVVLDLGWGRLVFGQTFADLRGIVDALRAEEAGERDICIYPRDPHVLVGLAPDELFIDPSYTYRLDLHRYRPRAELIRGVFVRTVTSAGRDGPDQRDLRAQRHGDR